MYYIIIKICVCNSAYIAGNKCSWKCYKCGNVPCKKWCSIYDTCGNTLVHKNHGVDCTGCPGN